MATRVQMDMPEKSFERLRSLKERLEASSYTEVVKDAIRVYEYFIKKDDEGTKFYVQEPGQNMVELKIFT